MKTRVMLWAAIMGLLLGISVPQAGAQEKKLRVITSIFPVYDFSRQVGKDKIDLTMMLPPGVESHTFSPTPNDVINLTKADVLVYTGRYMEPWVEGMVKGIRNPNLLVIDTSRDVELREEDEDHETHTHHHDSHHSGKDPHIWLDPSKAQIMVKHIAEGFALKDEANQSFYINNSNEYIAQLDKLDRHIQESLAGCKLKTILYAGHFAFGYFAKRYGLTHVSPYKGFSPDAAPSAKSIVELTNTITKLGAKTIFYEELIEPKAAKVITEKTGAEMVLLHGAHNLSKKEFEQGMTYLSIMQENLKKLKIGLQCP